MMAYLPSEMVYIEGHPHHIHVEFDYIRKPSCEQRFGTVTIILPWHTPISLFESVMKNSLIDKLKVMAQAQVESITQTVCTQLNRWPRSVRIKTQRSRWGSCGIHNDIYINWLLILAPRFVLEYVVVHECCHLFYRSHGVRFWQKVERQMPGYQSAERWLRAYGHFLLAPS